MSAAELQLAAQAGLALLQLLLFAAGIWIFLRVVAHLQTHGGAVKTAGFDLPDLLMSIVLAGTFGGLALKAAWHRAAEELPVRPDQVVQSGIFLMMILAGIAAFLHWRGLRLVEVFGLRRVPLLRVAGWAGLLMLGAFPFVGLVNLITYGLLKGEIVQQPLVEYFRDAAGRSDFASMVSVVVAAVVIAPMCEEFLFRGYFYAVGKRYAGPWISGGVTAILFAANHANLASLPGLTVLAVALTLAYERTGSLLVPMAMHALFNATSLVVLYAQGTGLLKP